MREKKEKKDAYRGAASENARKSSPLDIRTRNEKSDGPFPARRGREFENPPGVKMQQERRDGERGRKEEIYIDNKRYRNATDAFGDGGGNP